MTIQTTAGRHSEYHGESVINDNNNNMPAVVEFKRAVRRQAVVYKQIRIAMPRSLLKSLKILAKSKRIGVTKILLDVIREHVYAIQGLTLISIVLERNISSPVISIRKLVRPSI